MTEFDQAFPPTLARVLAHEFEYRGDDTSIDFVPFRRFMSAGENAAWIRPWTGNAELTGGEYRIFGQDGSGGLAAIWLARVDAELLEQPIVFFGSEGALGVVAVDFADFLWLLAAGAGPMEATECGVDDARIEPRFAALAEELAPRAKKPASEVLARAARSYPEFARDVLALCR